MYICKIGGNVKYQILLDSLMVVLSAQFHNPGSTTNVAYVLGKHRAGIVKHH